MSESIHDEVWADLEAGKPLRGQGVFDAVRVSVVENDWGRRSAWGFHPMGWDLVEVVGRIIDGVAMGQDGFKATFLVRDFMDRADHHEFSSLFPSEKQKELARMIRAYVEEHYDDLPKAR